MVNPHVQTWPQRNADKRRSDLRASAFICGSPIINRGTSPWLQDDAFVTGPARDLFPIEEFQQRNGVLARDAREIFEGSDVDQAIRFVLRTVRQQLRLQ